MFYEFDDIAQILQGELLGAKSENPIIDISIDTRKSCIPFRTIFFALKTDKNNAHLYIQQAYKNDVHHFVIEEDVEVEKYPKASFLKVNNTLEALQKWASHHRAKYQIPVIGITGSNGKTIVKEWLNSMLKIDNIVCRSPKSYNSQIGVPLSIFRLDSFHQLAIFEAGISQKNEMHHLEKIVKPTLGILTNIGSQHNEGFENNQEKLQEKMKLFANCNAVITHPKYLTYDLLEDKKFVFWCFEEENFQVKYRIQFEGNILIINNDLQFTTLEVLNKASKENLIHCILTLLELNIDASTIQKRIRAIIPLSMRLEMQEGIADCSIINDAYSNDFDSLRIALDFQADQKYHEKNTLFISDIEESGLEKEKLFEYLSELLSQYSLQKIYFVTEDIELLKLNLKSKGAEVFYYNTTNQLIKDLINHTFQNENVLIKGARVFQFEKIAHYFRKKTHRTSLNIDLNALTHNLHVYRKLLKPTTKIMVMVKALSYGSGSYEIASLLQYQKVDYLSVAYIDEAVELRVKGISLPIMVMNIDSQALEDLISYQLEPEIYSISQLDLILKKLEDMGVENQVKIPIHIKLDSGMHRLGFVEEEIPSLIDFLRENKVFLVRSCMSHLVGSDDEKHDEFTALQVQSFNHTADKICHDLNIECMRHILNSAGISRHVNYQMDMVRLGIGLYGCDASQEIVKKLASVSVLSSYILQIRKVKKEDSVGYDRKGVLSKDATIATVAIGYADGLPRTLSNGVGKMFVKDKPAPIVGNVCMDMTMIDISEIENVQVGDEVMIFGEKPSVMEVAKWAGTISYEILTGISTRVKRIYFKE